MTKLPPPPWLADQSDIEAALRRLYRRRLVVRRLIRSLECYARLNRAMSGSSTDLIQAPAASRHVH